MSGPKSNHYTLQREQLRRQEAARRAMEARQQEIVRQKRRLTALSRLQSAQAKLVVINKRFAALRGQYPEEAIETPRHIVVNRPPHDLDELEALAARAEHSATAAERQLLLQHIRINTMELEKLDREIQMAAAEFPEEEFNIDLAQPKNPDQHSLQALATFHQQLERILHEGRQAFTLTIDRARANASLLASLRSVLATLPDESLGTSKPSPAPKVDTLIKDQLDKALVPLANHPREEWPQEVLAVIAAIKDRTQPTPTNLLLLELRSRIQNFAHKERLRIADRKEAEAMLAELPPSVSRDDQPLLDVIAEQLCRIITGREQMTDDLRQRVRDIHETAEQTLDRQIAGEVIKDTLEELGYSVGESFSTLFVEGGAVHFQRPAWGNYHVRLRVNHQTDELRVHLVKEHQPGTDPGAEKEKDAEMEGAWCADYSGLMQALEAKGIGTKSIHRLPPGALPVPLMRPESTPSRDQQSRRGRVGRHDKKRQTF